MKHLNMKEDLLDLIAVGTSVDFRRRWGCLSNKCLSNKDPQIMPRRLSHASRTCQEGLTLVELMVSVLLAAIVSSGLFYLMSGQQKTYTSQLGQMTSQSNSWGAMEYLQSQIRRAGLGFTSCNGMVLAHNASSGMDENLPALVVLNDVNLFKTTNPTAPQRDGTDSFQIRASSIANTGQVMSVLTARRMVSNTSELHVRASNIIQPNDLVVLWEPGISLGCVVLQVNGAITEVVANRDYQVPFTNAPTFPSAYGEGSVVMRLGPNANLRNFAIDNTNSKRPPMLVTWTMTDRSDLEVIAEGIEDMQIAWACDYTGLAVGTCNDGPNGEIFEGRTVEEMRTDEWANNVQGDTTPPTCVFPDPSLGCSGTPTTAPIGMVRITLIARTNGPTPGDKLGFRPGAEDRLAGTISEDLTATGNIGTYGRSVLTTNTVPRNIRRTQ